MSRPTTEQSQDSHFLSFYQSLGNCLLMLNDSPSKVTFLGIFIIWLNYFFSVLQCFLIYWTLLNLITLSLPNTIFHNYFYILFFLKTLCSFFYCHRTSYLFLTFFFSLSILSLPLSLSLLYLSISLCSLSYGSRCYVRLAFLRQFKTD